MATESNWNTSEPHSKAEDRLGFSISLLKETWKYKYKIQHSPTLIQINEKLMVCLKEKPIISSTIFNEVQMGANWCGMCRANCNPSMFLILNEFTILTDEYFNPLQVIVKLWFVLSLFQILHYQLSGHEEKFRITHKYLCSWLLAYFLSNSIA